MSATGNMQEMRCNAPPLPTRITMKAQQILVFGLATTTIRVGASNISIQAYKIQTLTNSLDLLTVG